MPRLTKYQQSQTLNDLHEFGVNLDTREIYLHSYVRDEEDPGVDYRMSATLQKNIGLLNSISDASILIHLESVGGFVNAGMSIYDTIKTSQSHITTLGYGITASMGGIILQAADTRVLHKHCRFMAHYGNNGGRQNFISWKSEMEDWEKCIEEMLDIFAERCIGGEFFIEKGMDHDQVKDYLRKKFAEKQEWWLTAKEAVYYGFADAVLGDKGYETIKVLREF